MFRVAIVGLEHYHVTGWVESFEQFPDRIEIVGLYDADPGSGERLAPPYHDPVLSYSGFLQMVKPVARRTARPLNDDRPIRLISFTGAAS